MSREKITEDRDRIRCALASRLLQSFFYKDTLIDDSLMEPMAQSGILARKEYEEYQQAKNKKKRMRILRELRAKYDTLAKSGYLDRPKDEQRVKA